MPAFSGKWVVFQRSGDTGFERLKKLPVDSLKAILPFNGANATEAHESDSGDSIKN